MLSVKANCPDTFAQLAAIDWDGDNARRHADGPAKAHGRIEARRIAARDLLPKTLGPFPTARQAFRVVRERTDAKTGETSRETAYGITTVPAERAGPERLLAWNRGHWQVENGNHCRRDATMGEDASRVRKGHAPANNAILNNIALAVVFHRGFRHLPEANLHFMMRRRDALDAILSPTLTAPPPVPGNGARRRRPWRPPSLAAATGRLPEAESALRRRFRPPKPAATRPAALAASHRQSGVCRSVA